MLTTRETQFIDEIVALGATLVVSHETYDPAEDTINVALVPVDEDAFLAALVDEGFEDDVEAARAALEDMGEDPGDWIAAE